MARISLNALKARLVGSEVAEAPEAKMRAGMVGINARESLECSLGGVAAILNVALLDRAVEDFPSVVPLGIDWSGQDGIRLERTGQGTWRIDGQTKAMLNAELDQPGRNFALGAVLSAIGVEEGEGALQRLEEVAHWRGDPVDITIRLASVASFVPRHVLLASLGWGTDLLKALGAEADEEAASVWTETVKAMVTDLNEPPLPWMTPATVAACDRGDSTMLHALMQAGADIEARDGHGFTPLLATVRHGRFYGIKPCREWNADVTAQTKDGRTALHCAAEAAAEGRSENADGSFRLLIDLGCDPDLTDGEGRKASDILEAALADPECRLGAKARESVRLALSRLADHPATPTPR